LVRDDAGDLSGVNLRGGNDAADEQQGEDDRNDAPERS
jgi:hypothetical protein